VDVIIFIFFVFYFGLLKYLRTGWVKVLQSAPQHTNEVEFISVIIPVRNEEKTIGKVLDDLARQHYPTDKFEIIVVNDHSEDDTLKAVERHATALSSAKLTIVESLAHGKKAALAEGIAIAKGNIIVTTDADCRVKPRWLASINQTFNGPDVNMVAGPVVVAQQKTLFSKLQSVEFASLIGTGAATIAYNKPTMCNGANLAFRKKVFIDVNGYTGNEHIASGDDEFLMRKVQAKFPGSIRFNNNSGGIVSTSPKVTLMEFIDQRLRWAGKWKHNGDVKTRLLALFIFMFHLTVLSVPLLFLLGQIKAYALGLLLGKVIMEYLFLIRVTSWLLIPWHWPSFILWQVLYSFYAVSIGLFSVFRRPRWKGREI
jgi:poly-beta-1,6-N-acetyl-D-glucosamine synthase